MTEHLFKLKKDEKTVGYAHINNYGQLMFRLPSEDDWFCVSRFWSMLIDKYGFGIPPCSYHAFVTKDTNGKDVFADDEVKALYFWPDAKNPQTITGKIGWRNETFSWVLYHTPNTPECADLYQLFDIELTEGKE